MKKATDDFKRLLRTWCMHRANERASPANQPTNPNSKMVGFRLYALEAKKEEETSGSAVQLS